MNTTTDLSKPELLFELARGGMGAVHLARVGGMGGFERFVVVKRVLDTTSAETEVVERFLTEARIAARIHHANVVGTHHVGTDDGGLYMVLDYVEGGSLATLTDRVALRAGRMPIPIVLRIALDALAGLSAVHRATGNDGAPLGIVHRDVSLQNILVGRDGVARLADFGIAKSTHTSVKTKTGSLIGKLLYLPPEHIRQEPTDRTIDIYMLGVTLWCALTSEEPWQASDEAQLMHRILTDPVPSVASRRNEAVAPEIEALISTAAHPIASQRYQSAEQMAQVIEALGRERGWVASQHEVATFVEGLLGVDLDRRRERIAQIVTQSQFAPTRPSFSPEQVARKGLIKRLLWAGAALLLLATGLYLLPQRESVTAHDVPTVNKEHNLPAALPPTAAPQPHLENVDTTAAPTAAVPTVGEPAANAAATASTVASAHPNTSTRNPPVAQSKTVLPKTVLPRTELSKPTTPKPALPPSAPDDISPHNPYR